MEFTKEQLIEQAKKNIAVLRGAVEKIPGSSDAAVIHLKLAEITLASLEAEPVVSHIGSKNALDAIVAFIKSNRNPTLKDHNEVSERLFQDNCHGISNHVIEYIKKIGEELEELRSAQDSAPPAPVSVPTFDEWLEIRGNKPLGWVKNAMRESYDACRAAMLQGAEPVTTAYKLPELRYLDTVKFNADCALQDPESIYAQEFFMSLDEVFGERGNYTEPVQAKAVSILIAEIFRLRGYQAAPLQEE